MSQNKKPNTSHYATQFSENLKSAESAPCFVKQHLAGTVGWSLLPTGVWINRVRALKSVPELPHLSLESAVIYFAYLRMKNSASEGVECIKEQVHI